MCPQKPEIMGARTENVLRGRPECRRPVVWTVFVALGPAAGTDDADVFDHRIVPRDKLLRELARVVGADLIAEVEIEVHVTGVSLGTP
jgi:hypothetical protein